VKTNILIANSLEAIVETIDELISPKNTIFILMDENSKKYCFPLLKKSISFNYSVIVIKQGEQHKSFESLQYVLKQMEESEADKQSIIINLGGGVITDLGGFCASIYKRGVKYINIPTTVIAQTDAAVGGKTGIGFLGFKNNVGSFYVAEKIIIYKGFLKTLPSEIMYSSFSEIFKYALIGDTSLFKKMTEMQLENFNISNDVISGSLKIKTKYISIDPYDKEERKILNFGHTVGHAIESAVNENGGTMHHGVAVALGLMVELDISRKIMGLPEKDFQAAMKFLSYYKQFIPKAISRNRIFEIMKHDKKNKEGKLLLVLIDAIASPKYDVVVEEQIISHSIEKILAIN
jgi:3-dehydroquinate synthase